MLKLINITKDYPVANHQVHALKGISITFRDNEFVSILGPSGCGKTTLLNIIGGLDHYTSGDLFIDQISTKEFNDRDWDSYRNHRIGFVFQSYNLIPHQTILENVELALTIAGIGKEERLQRAKEVLDKVGLKNEYHKKPNQLSGGQCQRVAIARALVNNPDILLADEPTGALDSTTSIQIMELIKEISKDRLVIMVTHNPDIAKKYSSRIVKLLDGKITADSNPVLENELIVKKEEKVIEKKSKLSFWTAFKLSARNLRSKLKRTILTCVAGSIGIIGVATVLSVSTGVRSYINDMQEDMLSGNPITISETGMNLESLLSMTDTSTQEEALKDSIEDGYINVNRFIEYLVSQTGSLDAFRIQNEFSEEYLQFLQNMPKEYYAAIATYYGIDVKNNIYTNIQLQGYEEKIMSLNSIITTYTSMLNQTELKEYSSLVGMVTNNINQAVNNNDFIATQYDIISNPKESKFAEEANEIMLVVNDDQELTDLILAQLGYYTQEEFLNIIYKAIDSEKYDPSLDKNQFSYDELLNKTFIYYPNDTIFKQTDPSSPLFSLNPFTYQPYAEKSWENGIELKITAILKPKENVSYGCLSSGIYYTPALTQKIIMDNVQSQIVHYLNENEEEAFTSMNYNGTNIGIIYDYSYYFEDREYTETGFVGNTSSLSSFMGTITGQNNPIYTLTLRELGGCNLPSDIHIYPTNFELKDQVTAYLDQWNGNKTLTFDNITLTPEERATITYSDNLAVMISLIDNMINIVTIALVAFTALSLVVSTVMIAIITYVSVIERVKEIGVIRSLGGRKKDVSRLFNAETFIIGGFSGLIGIGVTYILSGIINLIVGNLANISAIAILPFYVAIIMVALSILLTLISGLIPALIASKKDPVEALRSE
ncbi:aBC transporter related [Firmicutes bacterium CAG:631]|nr:aBC transporter related [Firmicutes bacterium CAG:631]